MYKKKENKEAVSPVIAVILMVAITVVLAAVLFVMVQEYTKKQVEIEAPLGVREADGNSTHWVVSIIAGSADMSGLELRLRKDGITEPGYIDDAENLRSQVYADTNIVWIDSNNDETMNTGDTLLVRKEPFATPGTPLTDGEYELVGIKSGSQIITEKLTM